MIGRRNLLAPHAALKVGLPESKCSHMLCHTRMGERWRLSKPHAVLEIGLSDGAYSHSSCRAYPRSCGGHTRMEEWSGLSKRHTPLEAGLSESTCSLLRRTIPNDEAVEAAGIARDAGNQFVRGHMLSPVESISEWGERWGLLKLPAVPEASLPESTCSPMLRLTPLCPQMTETREPFFYPLAVLIKIWGMGLCPMTTHGP